MHRGVGHALSAANHAARELLGHDVSMAVDLKQRAQHQAILVRTQRALVRR